MFVPSAKSNISLLVLLLISILLFLWVEKSRVFISEEYFSEKLAAAELMQKAIDTIKEYRLDQNVFIDEINDPNKTGMIGDRQSLIVTDRGNLSAKLTSLNPNFAAAIVEEFKKAKLKKGDLVAVSTTGSYPAINLAIMSAAQILNLNLVIISSVGSSMFGATDPEFTILDMESYLVDKGIFQYKSVAASMGGGRDLGRGLNILGREEIIKAVNRNEVLLVHEESLEGNIQRKMEIFDEYSDGRKYDLYVNIGGGLSSLGNSINGRLLRPGLHRHVNIKNIPLKGTMFLFADKGIPILHLLDIERYASNNKLPEAPTPLPKPGTGNMFRVEIYNVTVAIIALIILTILVLVVIFFDHNQLKLRHDEIEI